MFVVFKLFSNNNIKKRKDRKAKERNHEEKIVIREKIVFFLLATVPLFFFVYLFLKTRVKTRRKIKECVTYVFINSNEGFISLCYYMVFS